MLAAVRTTSNVAAFTIHCTYTLPQDALIQRLQSIIRRVATRCRVSTSTAGILLHHCKWDEDTFLNQWKEDRYALAKASKVSLDAGKGIALGGM